MSQLLHAGIIAGRRQLAALVALTLILLVITPQDHIAQNSSASNKTEVLSATQLLPWAALLVALGLALTSNRSIDITASRIQRRSRMLRSPQHILMSLVAQFGLAAILFAIFVLQAPPNVIISVGYYFGFPAEAVSIVWTAVMSIGVASFGASAHAACQGNRT
jgi:ABC-type Na+ efflux pump permease subunit